MTQLKKPVKYNVTSKGELLIKIDSEFDINELDNFCNINASTIKKIELKFTSGQDVEHRSRMAKAIAGILNNIQEIEILILGSTVKDYVLESLLNLDATSNLKELGLRFKDSDSKSEVINTKYFFENTLSMYLSKNQNLKFLKILESHTEITARAYPKLAKALYEHTNLRTFEQEEFPSLSGVIKNNALEHDSELKKALERNYKNDPEIIKNNLIKQLESLPKHIFNHIKELDTNIASRKTIHSSDDRKEFINAAKDLRTKVERLKELKIGLSKPNLQIDNLDNKKTFIAVLIQYLTLLAQAAELKSLAGLADMAPFETKINEFWDITRLALLNDIKKVDSGDFDSIQKSISDEASELNNIRKRVPSRTYPKSYTDITESVSENLLKARKILDDYTKSNSAVSRFFHGHWNRHHVTEVHAIVMRIDGKNGKQITSTNELIAELRRITLSNNNGSLARRLDFITDNFLDSYAPENQSNSTPN